MYRAPELEEWWEEYEYTLGRLEEALSAHAGKRCQGRTGEPCDQCMDRFGDPHYYWRLLTVLNRYEVT